MVQQKKNRQRQKLLLFFLVLVILVPLITRLLDLVENQLLRLALQPVEAQEGTMEAIETVEMVVFRFEVPVVAPVNGRLLLEVAEGQRVAAGSPLGSVEPLDGSPAVQLSSPEAGMVCFDVDGLERVFSPHNLDELDWAKLKTLTAKIKASPPGEKSRNVMAGDTPLKVVDNLLPLLLMMDWSEQLPKLKSGSRVELRIERQSFIGILDRMSDNMAVIRLERGFEQAEAFHRRKVEAELVYQSLRGIIIPVQALVSAAGKQGVYLWEDGKVSFQNVDVLGQVGNSAAVQGLSGGSMVITNTDRAGQLLK